MYNLILQSFKKEKTTYFKKKILYEVRSGFINVMLINILLVKCFKIFYRTGKILMEVRSLYVFVQNYKKNVKMIIHLFLNILIESKRSIDHKEIKIILVYLARELLLQFGKLFNSKIKHKNYSCHY